MARRTRLPRPPNTGLAELDRWMTTVHDAINDLPNFSITSYGDLNSTHTGQVGDIAIDIAGGEGRLWIKHDDASDTSVWQPIATSGYGLLYNEEANAQVLAVTASAYSTMPAIYQLELTEAISANTGDEGYFQVHSEGTYQIQFTSSFTADTNTVWEADLFHNASATSFGFQRGIGTASEPGSGSFLGIVHASSEDSFHVGWKQDTVSTKGITILHAQFFAQKLL